MQALGSGSSEKKVRTLVFVSGLPRSLFSTPDRYLSSEARSKMKVKGKWQHKRAEEIALLHVLRGQANNVMEAVALYPPEDTDMQSILDDDGDEQLLDGDVGYALVLFGSLTAALEACSTGLTISSFSSADSGEKGEEVALRMRIVPKAGERRVADVYTSTIEVESSDRLGDPEIIDRGKLAHTVGLEEALHGRCSARWCKATKNGSDCPLGVSCHFLHLKEFQTTVKRGGEKERQQSAGASVMLSPQAMKELLPTELLDEVAIVRLSQEECKALAGGDDNASDEALVVNKLKGYFSSSKKYFIDVRTLCLNKHLDDSGRKRGREKEGGCNSLDTAQCHLVATARDAPLVPGSDLLSKMKLLSPMPPHKAQAPPQRDEMHTSMLRAINRLSCCTTAEEAAKFLCGASPTITKHLKMAAHDDQDGGGAEIVLAPWHELSSLFDEIRIFFAPLSDGEDLNMNYYVHCVLQRFDDVTIDPRSDPDFEGKINGRNASVRLLCQRLESHFLNKGCANQSGENCSISRLAPFMKEGFAVDVMFDGSSVPHVVAVRPFGSCAAAMTTFPSALEGADRRHEMAAMRHLLGEEGGSRWTPRWRTAMFSYYPRFDRATMELLQ